MRFRLVKKFLSSDRKSGRIKLKQKQKFLVLNSPPIYMKKFVRKTNNPSNIRRQNRRCWK